MAAFGAEKGEVGEEKATLSDNEHMQVGQILNLNDLG